MNPGTTISYQIDTMDRLIQVNESWTAFALANGGERVLPELVLGKTLWHFISDTTIQNIYRRLTNLARQGRGALFRYRCDSPQEKRIFQMRVIALLAGKVEFTSTLLNAEERPAIPLLNARAPSALLHVRICSWCHAVAWPGETWRPLESAAERLIGRGDNELPDLSHGICEACAAGMMAMMTAPAPTG